MPDFKTVDQAETIGQAMGVVWEQIIVPGIFKQKPKIDKSDPNAPSISNVLASEIDAIFGNPALRGHYRNGILLIVDNYKPYDNISDIVKKAGYAQNEIKWPKKMLVRIFKDKISVQGGDGHKALIYWTKP